MNTHRSVKRRSNRAHGRCWLAKRASGVKIGQSGRGTVKALYYKGLRSSGGRVGVRGDVQRDAAGIAGDTIGAMVTAQMAQRSEDAAKAKTEQIVNGNKPSTPAQPFYAQFPDAKPGVMYASNSIMSDVDNLYPYQRSWQDENGIHVEASRTPIVSAEASATGLSYGVGYDGALSGLTAASMGYGSEVDLNAAAFRSAMNDGPQLTGGAESSWQAFARGAAGGYAGVLDSSPNAAFAGKLLNDAGQSFKQFGYEMAGAQRADEARAAWNSGNYGLAAAKELQAFGEAGLAVMGTGPAVRAGAGLGMRAIGAVGEYAETKVAGLGEQYGLGLRLSVVPEGPNSLGAPIPRVDVTNEFVSRTSKSGITTLQYGDPDGVHGLLVNVDRQGVLGFDIRSPAGGSSFSDASGTDMFASAMQRLNQDGVSVSAIRGVWIEGTDSVNAGQYRANLSSGMSPQQAAANTWTGRIAERYGYTNIGVPNTAHTKTTVIFGR
ncbi:hypothetical protein AWB80_08396 [Caballeronia pedi]|uniref:Uncharacterized protein n=1 Tax=Caballeronia pedi TaxID=1777141 RepID=A0A158E6X0_9BURK|nr:hypothetical protein [Caballeronia pedi]SAL02599.1 hypothetical protein AWB80_08396 [Caballeronia pedi]